MSGAGSTNGSDPRVEPPAGKEEPKTEPQGESEHAHADTEGQQEGGVRPTAGAGASNKGLRSKLPSLLRFFSYPAGGSSGRIKRDRQYYERLPIEEKRALYTCGKRYRTLDDLPSWPQAAGSQNAPKKAKIYPPSEPLFSVRPDLNEKVSLWRGDITTLEIDAVVNAANSSLMGGGGVDGAIHSAAGWSLLDECETLGRCNTGDTKLTSGHRLPAKYILHTVGPMDSNSSKLRSCYDTSLQLVLKHNIRTVAFSCISTGVYGFPHEPAARIAMETIRKWLETDDNSEKVDRVIFCVFLEKDHSIYWKLLPQYFPLAGGHMGEEDVGRREGGEERDEEEGGGTPPPESPEGSKEDDGVGGRRSGSGGDDVDGDLPPAPRLEHRATAPGRTHFVDKTCSSSEKEPPENLEGKREEKVDIKETEEKVDIKETEEKEREEEVMEEQPEVREEPMDTSQSTHKGGSPSSSGRDTECNTREQPPPEAGTDPQPPEEQEEEEASKTETAV